MSAAAPDSPGSAAPDLLAPLDFLAIEAGAASGLIDDADAAVIGETVTPGNVGVVVVYENLWAEFEVQKHRILRG